MKTALVLLILSTALYPSCSRNVQTDEKEVKKETKIIQPLYDPQYEKEGFVSKNVYRVVIVADQNIGEEDMDIVKDQAKKRLLSSLQKYIHSQNKTVSQNTTAHLLNLIDSSGTLMKQDKFTVKSSVFFFDINKDNIKRYVDSIPQMR